jgi:lysosomal alpha-mannosidase
MLHRRLLHDDSLGVDEALNEVGSDGHGLIANGVLRLVFDSVRKSQRLHRDLSHRVNNQPLSFVTLKDLNLGPMSRKRVTSLPPNIHLLTLMKEFDSNSVIVRLEHFYEKHEDEILSRPMRVDLKAFFEQIIHLERVEELALGSFALYLKIQIFDV